MSTTLITPPSAAALPAELLDAHVVVVTNFIAAHRLPLYLELNKRVRKLTMLLSTPMEANRNWQATFGNLDVRIQKTTTLKRPRKHRLGFKDHTYVHIPWDTGRQLRELQPDLVLSAELGMRSVFSAWYRGRWKRRCPLVFWAGLSEHTEQGKGWHRHLLRKWLLRRCDAAVVNGASGARYLEKMGLAADRIFRIPYTALPDMYDSGSDSRPPELAHRLLFVGRQIEVKGLLPFLRSLATWGHNNPQQRVEFNLAGSGPLREDILATPLPDNVRVRLLGEKNYAEIRDCYAQAGIFAFPSLADDWGISVNEALGSGLPVLGSVYSQGVDELVVEGENGWRYRTDREDEVQSALDRAFRTSADRLNQMRQAARHSVAHLRPGYAADCLTSSLAQVYQRFHSGT